MTTFFAFTAAHAQVHSSFDSAVNVFNNNIHHLAGKNKVWQLVNSNAVTRVNDNCVVQLQQPTLQFQYNVNNMEVYQATPDNIYIVKPDPTISLPMPVAGAPASGQ